MSDLTIRTTPTNNPDSAVDLSKIEVKDGQEIDLYEIHRAFQTITQECPEKLWPNTRQEWTGTELVVFHKGQEQAWTWKVGEDSSPKMIRSIPFEELDPDLRTSEFADDTTGDTKLISYRIDGIHGSTQDKFLSLTLHEGFHYVGQDSWTLPTNAHPGNRSTSVPYHYEARYYRSMIIEQ